MDDHTTPAVGYSTPELKDLGSLREITEAEGFTGPEDGANKLIIHHIAPEMS